MKCWPASFTLFLISFSLPQLCLAQKGEVRIEKGVSRALAVHRERTISNVLYRLRFELPASRPEKIQATETISFQLNSLDFPVQIDFKETSDHLKQVSVNGQQVPIDFRNEHIIIQKSFLKRGLNSININFIAGELSLNRNAEFLYTLLVPDRARTLFPCFDQPGIKARFQLSLGLPADWSALSNAPLQDSLLLNGRKVYNYVESDRFSTYLFSFVAGKFRSVTKQLAGHTYEFYHRETDSSKLQLSTDTIFEAHAAAIRFLEGYTGIKHPFKKLHFAAIPDFQYGGMEHVGAIDYKAATLFLDSGATTDQENARSNLIAHETAHMWFGNLVTMQWFNDVWMKEVFANFIADKITQDSSKGNSYELKFLLSHLPRAYAVDRTEGANPIRQPLENLQDAGSLYGAIIYNKAPVMMQQLEKLMGANAFREGIREYLKTYSFSNADWPQLIKIMDNRTSFDLEAWNRVWVNTPGRPRFNYRLTKKGGRIAGLSVEQKGERTGYWLPQSFELALVYENRVESLAVEMNKVKVDVKEAIGKELPLYILFNSSGQGYGLFPIDPTINKTRLALSITKLTDPLMRASAYINWYENMLEQHYWRPQELLEAYFKIIAWEKEELNLNLLATQLTDIFWRLIPPAKRNDLTSNAEALLWNLVEKEEASNHAKILFKTLQSIALTRTSLDRLYFIWKHQQSPGKVKLTEDDYTSLALNLAVKAYNDTTIIKEQGRRISNQDRKNRLAFLEPAVSKEAAVRDAFFQSLKDLNVRKRESWVAEGLALLHHPLRANTSVQYIKEGLEMLEEIGATGDIFFPLAWLNSTLGSYQSIDAAGIVRSFLKANPGYNPRLKAKILQATDPLFRAEKLSR